MLDWYSIVKLHTIYKENSVYSPYEKQSGKGWNVDHQLEHPPMLNESAYHSQYQVGTK